MSKHLPPNDPKQLSFRCQLVISEKGVYREPKDVNLVIDKTNICISGKEMKMEIPLASIEDTSVYPDNTMFTIRYQGSFLIHFLVEDAELINSSYLNVVNGDCALSKSLSQQRVAIDPISISVYVIEARKLLPKDWNGFSDPYAVIMIDNKKIDTPIIKKSLDPVWNYHFKMILPHDKLCRLVINLWDHDRIGKDDFLGAVDVNLYKYDEYKEYDLWIPLSPRPGTNAEVRGDLHIRFCIKSINFLSNQIERIKKNFETSEPMDSSSSRLLPKAKTVVNLAESSNPKKIQRIGFEGQITKDPKQHLNAAKVTLEIMNARGLPQKLLGGNCDPYCYIRLRNTPSFSYKTKSVPGDSNPHWNETVFMLVLDPEEIIELDIYNKNMIMDTFLGSVVLDPFDAECGEVRDMWCEIQGSRARSLSRGESHRSPQLGDVRIKITTVTLFDLEQKYKSLRAQEQSE